MKHPKKAFFFEKKKQKAFVSAVADYPALPSSQSMIYEFFNVPGAWTTTLTFTVV